jgi:probable HAF family extracellular repeat protein
MKKIQFLALVGTLMGALSASGAVSRFIARPTIEILPKFDRYRAILLTKNGDFYIQGHFFDLKGSVVKQALDGTVTTLFTYNAGYEEFRIYSANNGYLVGVNKVSNEITNPGNFETGLYFAPGDTTYRNVVIPGLSNDTELQAVNSSGVAVGNGETDVVGGDHRFYTYSADGTVSPLSDPAYKVWMTGINDAGWIIGQGIAASSSRAERPMLIIPGQPIITIGTIGGQALAINEIGAVVGTSGRHAFFWQNGNFRSLGDLAGEKLVDASSRANFINDHNQVVGYSEIGELTEGPSGFCCQTRGFYWDESLNAIVDLSEYTTSRNGNPMIIEGGNFINNFGQISSFGYELFPDGTHGPSIGWLLTPVPEPATVALLMGGWLSAHSRRRRRSKRYYLRRLWV